MQQGQEQSRPRESPRAQARRPRPTTPAADETTAQTAGQDADHPYPHLMKSDQRVLSSLTFLEGSVRLGQGGSRGNGGRLFFAATPPIGDMVTGRKARAKSTHPQSLWISKRSLCINPKDLWATLGTARRERSTNFRQTPSELRTPYPPPVEQKTSARSTAARYSERLIPLRFLFTQTTKRATKGWRRHPRKRHGKQSGTF